MARDDLFTHIHKALRKGLFDLTVRTGATDWDDPDSVAALDAAWRPFSALLHSHARHEDDHILRILDPHEPAATVAIGEQHEDLEALLDDLDVRFEALVKEPDPAGGLSLYRDLARFVAAYLPHLHQEETEVMARVWALCSDEELALTRAAFMAEVTPEENALTLELMLPAIDNSTRVELIGRLAATAPPFVLELVLSIAQRSLDTNAYAAIERALNVTSSS